METKFQTSFIPKKPIVPVGGASSGYNSTTPHSHSVSIFMSLAVLIFLVSIIAAGGMYFWKSFLLSSQESYKTQLAQREKQFNADLIEELKRQDIKIDLAKDLILNHMAASEIFDIIGRLTIEKVRFSSMDLSTGTDGIKISLKGFGTNLSAVAFQSDVLSKLEEYGLRKVVKNPILSDPALDTNGTVSFGLTATVDPASLSYTKSVNSSLDSSNASSSSSQ
ncbi:MAG: hypothetical protein AAB470_02780 [Patescibacteria group bacterium]